MTLLLAATPHRRHTPDQGKQPSHSCLAPGLPPALDRSAASVQASLLFSQLERARNLNSNIQSFADFAIELGICGKIHLAHPASAESGADFAAAEFCACGNCHRFSPAVPVMTTG